MKALIHEKNFALPKEIHAHSLPLMVLGCAFTILLWAGATVGIYLVWGSSLFILNKAVLTLVLGFFGGYGILNTGFLGHDGTHFTLHSNRVVSSVLGILMTSAVPVYLLMGFTISHWNHHKYTNTEKDPDAVLFSRFKTFLSRALFARPYTFFEYGRTAVKLAFGIPLEAEYTFPLPKKTIQRLAQFNLLVSLLGLTAHALVLWNLPLLYLSFLFVLLCGSIVSGISPYIEHTGTGVGRGQDTRTSTGLLWDILYMGNNYHLEHHLYPTLPFYRLKDAHQYLKAQGYYDTPRFVSHGVVDMYRYAGEKYPYPLNHL